MKSIYEKCNLCPRECGVNRKIQKGYCRSGEKLLVARAALHYWEEPCISGDNGSGTVFFGGCSIRCIYCQNCKIRDGKVGKEISTQRLAEIFLELQDKNANNINLVTPTHYIPHIIEALDCAKLRGLKLPVVYNTGGYEKAETLKMLNGYVDVYLPDFKYISSDTAKEYSNAPDYADYAKTALAEMVNQVGNPQFDEHRIMTKGVIVRHLLLPGHLEESKKVVEYLFNTYENKIYLSLMNQYTPMPEMANHRLLSRKVTDEEYDELINFAVDIGVENGFVQEGETALESFIPPFDNSGV